MRTDVANVIDVDALQNWVGRSEESGDLVDLSSVRRLCATLDQDPDAYSVGDELPLLWHWVYFLPVNSSADTAADGHATKGSFLPAVPLPRRMWAGSRLSVNRPIRIGDELTRVSSIENVELKKRGESPMVFVTVRHRLSDAAGELLDEEQSIVYLPPAADDDPPARKRPPPEEAQWSSSFEPNAITLFRYSALTFNGHRIHYDRQYAVREERYPGLVVHAPLTATLLCNELKRQRPDAIFRAVSFRALQPLFESRPFDLQGRIDGNCANLWALSPDGGMAMQMEVELGNELHTD